MEQNFNNLYHSKFNELNENVPDGVWDNIAEQLDLNDVWNKVDSKLTGIARTKKIFRYASYTSILLLLIGSGILFFTSQHNSNNAKLLSNYPFNSIEKNNIVLKTNEPQVAVKINKQSEIYRAKIQQTNNGKLALTNESNKLISINRRNNKNKIDAKRFDKTILNDRNKLPIVRELNSGTTLSEINLLSQNGFENYENNFNTSHELSIIDLPIENKSTNNLIVGVSGTLSNSWLLNSTTYNGLKASRIDQTKISFGYCYSVLVGYDYSSTLAFQSEWMINDLQTQNYINWIEGKIVKEKIEINYSEVNLLAKKKNKRYAFSSMMPASLNYIGGVQVGKVKSIYETINGEQNLVNENYNKTNMALVLGVEYQLYLKHRLAVFAGIRANVGVRNLTANNKSMLPSVDKTYNSSLALNAGLFYSIPFSKAHPCADKK